MPTDIKWFKKFLSAPIGKVWHKLQAEGEVKGEVDVQGRENLSAQHMFSMIEIYFIANYVKNTGDYWNVIFFQSELKAKNQEFRM